MNEVKDPRLLVDLQGLRIRIFQLSRAEETETVVLNMKTVIETDTEILSGETVIIDVKGLLRPRSDDESHHNETETVVRHIELQRDGVSSPQLTISY